MTRAEMNNFRAVLNAKHAEATRALGRRDGLTIERTPDALDEVQFAAARELSTRNLERESSLLREVRAALDRIADDSYGSCLHCEEDISPKRLKAMPWATLCIACQEYADQNWHRELEHETVLRDAA
ncbi:MAG: TraR/DksA family transcriptional regulator [Terriglobia bacterium]|nr:MAG: TraR/DksA family transcriptional regulator [Terriglobia bacterium]